MTPEERLIKTDRMRYTKDKFAANLILLAILLDALYFISIYKTDVGTYYYTWMIGASIIYNLLFLLTAFLASEGVKSRKNGYTGILIFIGLMKIVRVFYLPAKAHAATININNIEQAVMTDGQYTFTILCLIVSGVCCVAAAIASYIHNKTLADYMKSLENQTV